MTWKRIADIFRRPRMDRELEEEIAAHLALQEEEFRRQGMDPRAARSAALREFGGVAQATEEHRERRGVSWVEAAFRDARYALRGLLRSPGFTAAAVLSLALGIGANTAIFSMFQALMLRMLPVTQPRELVYLFQTGAGGAGFASPSLYLELAKRTDLFAGVLARRGVGTTRLQDSATAKLESVSSNYFDVLGVQPAFGRFFAAGETDAAVLSYSYWQNRCNSDPSILGRTLATETTVVKIIGVAARGFAGVEVENAADIWTPLTIRPTVNARFLWILGRLKPGVSAAAAQTAVDSLMANFQRNAFSSAPPSEMKRQLFEQRIEVRDGGIGISFLRDRFGRPLTVLFGLVVLVLLATCANIAHLLLARGAARTKEIAVRCSLGASPARLAGEAMMESLLLALTGCLGGVVLSAWGGRYLLLFLPAGRGTLDLTPDRTVLGFALAASLLCALIFGVAPAIRAAAIDPVAGLREAGGRGRPLLRRLLVAGQVALSVFLVGLAALFVHSLVALRSVNLGFSEQAITFWLSMPPKWRTADEDRARNRLLQSLAEVPGVTSVSHSAPDLLQGGSWRMLVKVPGDPRSEREDVQVGVNAVGSGYLTTIGAGMVAGRDIGQSDSATAPKIGVVNEAFVRTFCGGDRRVLGQIFSLRPEDTAQQFTIVGLVRDIAHRGMRSRPEPQVYVAASQMEAPMPPSIVVASTLPSTTMFAAIRAEVARLGSDVSMVLPRTLQQRLDDSIFEDRMLAALSGFFGALALALAGVGLYGLVSYTTERRASEIGVRVALGATRGSVLWLVTRDALVLVLGGLALGMPLAVAGARAVRSLLFGVQPGDPTAFILAGAVLIVIGAAAALLPAQRAASSDPTRVLRVE